MVMATYSIVRATLNSEEVDQQCVARCVLKLFCSHLQRSSAFDVTFCTNATSLSFSPPRSVSSPIVTRQMNI